MTPSDFVIGVRAGIVNGNCAAYRSMFRNTDPQAATDPQVKKALQLFRELSDHQQAALLEIVRQVVVDTTSNMLGVLDGVNSLPGIGDLALLGPSGEKLNGNLQDLFLADLEDNPQL